MKQQALDQGSSADADPLRQRILALLAADPFSAAMPIELLEARPGYVRLAMKVRPAQMNAHGTCHGGAIWTLADMAFGAAGYYDGTVLTVGADLIFIRPASAAATLYAEARQTTRKGATGLFQIEISTGPGDPDLVVAAGTFSGRWARFPAPETVLS